MIPGMHPYRAPQIVNQTATDRLRAALEAHTAAQKPRIIWVNGKAQLAPK